MGQRTGRINPIRTKYGMVLYLNTLSNAFMQGETAFSQRGREVGDWLAAEGAAEGHRAAEGAPAAAAWVARVSCGPPIRPSVMQP